MIDPVDSHNVIIVRSHYRVKMITGYMNGTIVEKDVEIYGAASEDSFYRIVALRELYGAGFVIDYLSTNIFVLTPCVQQHE